VSNSINNKKNRLLSRNALIIFALMTQLCSCIQSGSETATSSNTPNKTFNTIHDLRFSSPPGTLDSRLFYGINFSKDFTNKINESATVNVKLGNKSYLSASIKELVNNPKVSFIPHSLTKNTSAKITVSLKGDEISSQIIKLKPGQYTKL